MTSPKDISSFIDRQISLLRRERDTEVEESNLLLSNCTPKLLEKKGLALLNISVASVQIGLGGRSLIELERPQAFNSLTSFPPHTFRPGDIARIERYSPSASSSRTKKQKTTTQVRKTGSDGSFEGVVYKVTEGKIVLAVDPSQTESSDVEFPDRCVLLKLANNVTYERMEKTMELLRENLCNEAGSKINRRLQPGARHLADVLLGVSQRTQAKDWQDIDFYDQSLNDSQQKAVRFALSSNEVACIHGPPGTGKTHTLIEIIRQLLFPRSEHIPENIKTARKVLVCGASNLAVDNILERLLVRPPLGLEPIKCTRIGHPARVKGTGSALDATLDAQSSRSEQAELVKDVKAELSETLSLLAGSAKGQKGKKPRGEERKKLWESVIGLRKEYRVREKGVVSSVLREAQVVLATCHSSGGRILDNIEFDVVIIDEATQALEAACWIPILKGRKVILAGDPMQLPPTVLAQGSHESSRTKGSKATVKIPSGLSAATQDTKPSTKEKMTASKGKDEGDSDSGSVSSDPESDSGSETLEVGSNASSQKPKKAPSKDKSASSKVLKSFPRPLRPPRSLEVTMFERLEKMFGPSIKRMLEVQYRMHETICTFPSKTLYGNRLRSDPSVARHLLQDLESITIPSSGGGGRGVDESELLTTPVVFFDTAGCEYFEKNSEEGEGDEGSKSNENEATLVKNWVDKLVANGILPSQIAVLSPYQAQVTLISSLLSPLYGTELEVGTVDGMQGREKEAIVISLVRSNENREVGFLKDKRRLNVAMTRAKRHMCVIGDSSTVQHGGGFLKKWMAWLEENAEVYYGGLEG